MSSDDGTWRTARGILGAGSVLLALAMMLAAQASRADIRMVADAVAASRPGGDGVAGPDESGHSMGAVPAGSPADWFSPADYPPAAIRASRTGRVVVAVGIDSTGAVVTCRIVTSSGTDLLDQRTCELAQVRGRFNPATDASGRPIASEYILPVRWAMPDGTGLKIVDLDRPAEADARVTLETTFDAEGQLLGCRVLASSGGAEDGDPSQAATIGKAGAVRWRRAGRNVGARVVQTVTYHAEPLP